jgi:ADP-heptose:LPS heptosyltransferase
VKIILAPYSAKLHTGNPNPKVPPIWFWLQVVSKLNSLGHEVIQIGGIGEDRIDGVIQHYVNWPLRALRFVVEDADTFISVDSFLPHFVWAEKLNKRGVVIFSLSDPNIWGHPQNINLLKGREFVRPRQYQDWNEPQYNADAFVSPDEVIDAVTNLLAQSRPQDRTTPIPDRLFLAQQA